MNRTTLIERVQSIGASLAANAAKGVEITWDLAQACTELRATYSQGSEQVAAFLATAATASGKGEDMIRNLVRAVEVREGLTKAQKDKVADWSYDAVLTLASAPKADGKGSEPMSARQRTSLIGKVEKAGTTNVKVVRDLKRQVVGGSKRTRSTSADATTALVEKVRETVEKFIADGMDPLTLIAGAQLAQDNAGQDIAAAIGFVVKNPAKVAEAATS